MFHRRMFVSTTIFMTLFSLLCLVSAEAHTFTIVPDLKIHNVAVGSEYTVKLSNTDAFLYADLYGVSADMLSARFLYKDGTETRFPEFKIHSVDVEVKSGDKVIIGKRSDYTESKAILEKEGTVILEARIAFPYRDMPFRGYSKQVLNVRKDGRSTERVGGSEVVEIVPLSDVADFAPGKTVAFKVFLKGQPLKDAEIEWADEKSPVLRAKRPDGRLGSPQNTTEIAATDENGIFDFTLRNAGYNCFGLMPWTRENGKMNYYPSTLIVDVPASAADGSASAIIPVKPTLPEAVSKDEKLQSVAAQPFSDLSRAEKAFSASFGFTSGHLAASSSGAVTVSQAVAEAARSAAEKSHGKVLPGKVNPMPLLKTKLAKESSADIAVMGIELMGSMLAGTSPADIKLVKVTGPEAGVLLGYLSDPAGFRDVRDGAFTILDDRGTVVSSIDPVKKYILTLLIKDNGSYDLNREARTIVDPVVILSGKTQDPTPKPDDKPGKKSSGGCDAGYGGFALLLAAAFLQRRKA